MAIQQPISPPNVSNLPAAPNSASDTPSEFDTKANAYVAAQIGLPPEINASNDWVKSTADITYNNAINAEQSAVEAQVLASDALAAGNLLGKWVDQTGSASIGDSVDHDNGIWRLLVNLADITASEPSLTNSDWRLTFKRASDADIEAGTQYANPDAEQVKNKLVQREWESLTTGKKYNESCFYQGKQYVVRNPISDDQIDVAPPLSAGRSYFEYATTDSVTINLNLISGQQIKANYKSPYKAVTSDIITGIISLNSDGTYDIASGFTVFIDGAQVSSSTKYETDGLKRQISLTLSTNFNFSTVSLLSDLEIFNDQGERIHYYPLRTDAIDYLAGNLVKDEEFTWSGNWVENSGNGSISVIGNAVVFTGGNDAGAYIEQKVASLTTTGTYRVLYDYDFSAGEAHFNVQSSGGVEDSNIPASSGKKDLILPITELGNGKLSLICSINTVGTVKNFRVIKLNELSPSASFSSSVGFTLSGGVTITGGQAVFGNGAGTKYFKFPVAGISVGKKYAVAYKVNGTTTGTFRPDVFFNGQSEGVLRGADGEYKDVITVTSVGDRSIGLITQDGWDGNVEYFSVTEVTDGTVNGSIEKNFDRYWQLTNGEQSIEKSAGVIGFNDVPLVLTGSNYKIAPLSTANLRDRIVVSRAGELEPVIELDADDIAAGRRITHPNSQPDTEITLDSNDKITLEFNGQDLEVYRG